MPVPGVAAKAFLLKFAVLQHQIANAARINTGLNLAAPVSYTHLTLPTKA